MAHRPAPRTMTVLRSRRVTPNMLRITLGGDGMSDYPPDQKGGYVKLMLGPDHAGGKPVVRTYTIRDQRPGEMDVDFALHENADGPAGPATGWALAAKPDDKIELGGPGPAKPLPLGFDSYLIAGDMTALPAISANLEALPADATGFVALEIQQEGDRQPLAIPPGVTVRWLINAVPGSQPDLLEAALREQVWLSGRVYAWVACEFSAMRRLRAYLREERGLAPEQLYLSSYWKSGFSEEAHRVAKRKDAEGSWPNAGPGT